MSSKLSYKFKMVLLGESGSGKTSLFNHIFNGTPKRETGDRNTPNSDSISGIRYEHRTKDIQVSGDQGNATVHVRLLNIELANY